MYGLALRFASLNDIGSMATLVASRRCSAKQSRHEGHSASLFYRVCAPTHTARREQEPVHEDALAVVVWVVRQKSVPLVFLLTAAVVVAFLGLHRLANFLLYCLLQVLGVDDGSNLACAVRGPVRCDDFHGRLAGVHFIGRGPGKRGAGPLRPGVDGLAVVRLVVVSVAAILIG